MARATLAALLSGAAAALPSVAGTAFRQLLEEHYPAQYVVQKLADHERIEVDGHLDEPAWAGVPWLEDFLDLAGPRYQGNVTWQQASRDCAHRCTGDSNPIRVKLRWDREFLYVGAELRSQGVAASVREDGPELHSDTWPGEPVLPYFDDDFEVFVDASQDNYHYVEHELNAGNASYSTLWTLPQAGLGSLAPECAHCCNTTWNYGKGLCDHGPEAEGYGWTMEMYDRAKRPGSGMLSAVQNRSTSWSLEVRFPILANREHGGLVNSPQGEQLHPSRGERFWWATFAAALHEPWWRHLDAAAAQPQRVRPRCDEVIAADSGRQGFSQFLVDANNAAVTCYYEVASQHLGGHRYMHNPDSFGYLQFAAAPGAPQCRNVQWPARFVLAQVYQAQVRYLVGPGNGSYTRSLAQLMTPSACRITDACNATALALALSHVSLEIVADEGAKLGPCVRYAVGSWQTSNWTGGPCFNATVSYTVQSRRDPARVRRVEGVINEARFLQFKAEVGQRWDEADADWLCLDDVVLDSLVYV